MLKYFTRNCSSVAVFLLVILIAPLCRAGSEVVTITLPAAVIEKSVRSLLPLPIEPQNGHLQGQLVLDSIDKLVLKENGAHVQGMVLGRNIVLVTKIGDRNLKLKVGEVRLPLTCDLTFRFDRVRKILYVKPVLQPPAPTNNPQADAILPFLVLLNNREFPLSLAALQTFNARLGDRDISVAMELVDVRITAEQVVVQLKPGLTKLID